MIEKRKVGVALALASLVATLHCYSERDALLLADGPVGSDDSGSMRGSSDPDRSWDGNEASARDAHPAADDPSIDGSGTDAAGTDARLVVDGSYLDGASGDAKTDGGWWPDARDSGVADGPDSECSILEPSWTKSDFKEVSFEITNSTGGTIYVDTAYYEIGKFRPEENSWTITNHIPYSVCPCRSYCGCSDISYEDAGKHPFCTVSPDRCGETLFCDPDFSFATLRSLESAKILWNNYVGNGRRFMDCHMEGKDPAYIENDCMVFESLGTGVFKLGFLYSSEPLMNYGFHGKTACLEKEFVLEPEGMPPDVKIDIVDEPTLEDQTLTPADERCCLGFCRFR